MTVWAGTLPPLPSGDVPDADEWVEILNALHALTDAWSTYTPVWSASGGTPVINNGILESRYSQAGKLIHYTGRLQPGTLTTFSTGTYSISTPVTAENGNRYLGSALLLDSSTPANNQSAVTRMDGGTAIRFYGSLVGGQVGATVPFTLATGDSLIWAITYAAA